MSTDKRPFPLLTRSAWKILCELFRKHSTPKDLHKSTGLAPRTISNALNSLMECNMIGSYPNMRDMRQDVYYPICEHDALTYALHQSNLSQQQQIPLDNPHDTPPRKKTE